MPNAAEFADLPRRVESLERNVAEFRLDVRGEFGEVRAETRAEFAAVRTEIKSAIKESEEFTHRQMLLLHDDLVQRIDASKEELRREMTASDDETRRQMRVLHEDLVERIKRIGEAKSGS